MSCFARFSNPANLIVAVALAIPAVACDSSGPTTPSPPPETTPVTPVTPSGDNWSFRVDASSSPGLSGLDGAFNTSGETVSAYIGASGRCFGDSDRVQFTGTRSGNAVQLVSNPLRGQVIRLAGVLSAAGDAFDGTYEIAGGCGTSPSGPIKGRRVDWTGVWTGQMGGLPTVFDLKMAARPDSNGNFELSGSAKFSNTSCFPDAVLERRGRGRILFPDIVSGSQRLELFGFVSEDLLSMQVPYVLVSGVCPELSFGEGLVSRPPASAAGAGWNSLEQR